MKSAHMILQYVRFNWTRLYRFKSSLIDTTCGICSRARFGWLGGRITTRSCAVLSYAEIDDTNHTIQLLFAAGMTVVIIGRELDSHPLSRALEGGRCGTTQTIQRPRGGVVSLGPFHHGWLSENPRTSFGGCEEEQPIVAGPINNDLYL
jgi:hypothetical protein